MASSVAVADEAVDTRRGDRLLAAYFRSETRKLADACLTDVKSWDDWAGRRELNRQQLREMLALEPLPERTPLRPVVTGKVEHADFTVEKLHFQSRPHLYVTANLYVPKNLDGPAPAVLYVCGHSASKKDGVSYGNKTKYQHHGAWFARNGYVCLVIDTLQLGEIEGIHHGTYREGLWWWNARGYTPAGVETWNSIRALDYLESRPEVDAERIGVTGRSGGGAYSWFLAALDDRIKVAVPVAGITNLKSHVVDGCVEGHCDCMYFVNTYRWDYAQLAALVAPRPLLISNTDQDRIFPLDGVMDIYNKVRRLYELDSKLDQLGLQIAFGPHEDTQVLQVHAFQWFNHHFKGDDRPITMLAENFFEPEQLKVFDALPADEINTRVHDVFTPAAPQPTVPESNSEWQSQRCEWLKLLREKCFAGWPAESKEPGDVQLQFEALSGSAQFRTYDFETQNDVTLRLFLLLPANVPPAELKSIELRPLDAAGWSTFVAAMGVDFGAGLSDESLPEPSAEEYAKIKQELSSNRGLAFIAPRGIGLNAWDSDPAKQTHIRRRFMLLGQTLDGMRVWDVRRAIQALRTIDGFGELPLSLIAEREMAGIALYAALFEPNIEELHLHSLAKSHRDGPNFLNVLRFLDVPQAVAMAAEKSHIRIHGGGDHDWDYPRAVAQKLGFDRRIEIEQISTGRGK
ncbi:MAG: acetylxylan esterase [Pirellulales bacterium]